MKYQPTYDQVATGDLKLGVEDGLLLDMIVSAPVWANKITNDGKEYYFLAQAKIMEELPTVFKSKPAVTRAVKRLHYILDYVLVGRCNYYRIDKRLSDAWGKKNKGEEYQNFIDELFRKRNSSGSGTVTETELNSSGSGTIPPKIVPKVEPINQPVNPPTKINQLERFTRPSDDDCKNYLTEIGADKNHIDDHVNRFIAHYDSVDWVVGAGGNPMKDWQASLRGWVMRAKDFKQPENFNNENSKPNHDKPKTANTEFWDSVSDAIPDELRSN